MKCSASWDSDGRALYAGHAELDWPDAPYAQLWHAITLLREYRGDGHIAALATHGLNGIEALITHIATGTGFDPEFGRRLRGWSQEQWDAAVTGLEERGLLDDAGQLTAAGNELRSKVEDLTDELAYAPWQTIKNSWRWGRSFGIPCVPLGCFRAMRSVRGTGSTASRDPHRADGLRSHRRSRRARLAR